MTNSTQTDRKVTDSPVIDRTRFLIVFFSGLYAKLTNGMAYLIYYAHGSFGQVAYDVSARR